MKTSFEVFPMLLGYAWNRNIKPLKFAITPLMRKQLWAELQQDFNYFDIVEDYELATMRGWLPEGDNSYWGFVLGYPVANVDYPGCFVMMHTTNGEYLWDGKDLKRFRGIDGQVVEVQV